MKKNNLLQGAIVALLVSSPFAVYADSQYPATDFEPKVLYQDESIKSAAPAVKAAPAAASVATSTVTEDDSKYPATNFQPKIVYQDANYKHDKNAPSLAPTSAPAAVEYTSSAGAVVMEQHKTESDNTSVLILAILAAVGGFVLFNKKGCAKAASNDTVSTANRETGVTRYLNARVPKISGVTKYLERTGKPTNVARYIAKQNIAQKAAQNDTDRG